MHPTITALTLALLTGATLAGPLTPPPGPVAPTMKTIAEAEPRTAINATNTPGDANSSFRITQPGSYYLTGNITGAPGKSGIEIAASGVTIDLGGFTLSGGAGSLDGIGMDGARSDITVRDGTVTGWGSDGINIGEVANIRGAVILRVISSNNGAFGIRTGRGAVVRDCAVSRNANIGISVITGSTVAGCSVVDNLASGIAAAGSTVTDCSVVSCGGSGIHASGTRITGCTVRSCDLDGISASSSCVVTGNSCSDNGSNGSGAGIILIGSDCVIEQNTCTGNDYGIQVFSNGNLIVRNTCSGNSSGNYEIGTGNRYGPIVNATASGAAAASGNSAPSTLGSTDPNANFAF
jgi:parallel beta-helix repeat protein